jgi:hypothetical protein
MNGVGTTWRALPPQSLRRGLVLLTAPLLLAALVAAATHFHADPHDSHHCVVCALGHAPATVGPVTIVGEPSARVERLVPVPVAAPRSSTPTTPPTRAPPTA